MIDPALVGWVGLYNVIFIDDLLAWGQFLVEYCKNSQIRRLRNCETTVKPRYNELEGTVKSLVRYNRVRYNRVRYNRVRYNRILCKSAYVWVLYRMRIISIRDVF